MRSTLRGRSPRSANYQSQMSHMFGDDLGLSHRIPACAAPRRHRRYAERV
jgi:hypothetical protein